MNDVPAPDSNNDSNSTLENTEKPVRERITDLVLKVASGLVSVAGVAVIGQAAAWVRFDAADLPANQAIVVLGQAERVANGAVALALFLLAGALAVALVFVLDRNAQPQKPQTRWGMGLLMAAAVIGGSLMALGWSWEFAVTTALVVASILAIWFLAKDSGGNPWKERLIPLGVLGLLLAVVGLISGGEGWFPLLFLGMALALGGISLGIAWRTGSVFRWYGVAVFLSAVVFGAVVSAARTYHTPKVQPVAVLVQNGDSVEGVSGIYITDNNDRLYVGSVELSDDDAVVNNSGAIFWIPCERVITYSVGALQGAPVALEHAQRLVDELNDLPLDAPPSAVEAPAAAEDAAAEAQDTDQPSDTPEEVRGSCGDS